MNSDILVIDASVAIKAILPNPMLGHCQALVETFVERQPAAPVLWAYETTSAITKSVHFGQTTASEGRQALEKLDALGVRLFMPEAGQNQFAFDWALQLKRASAYDCFYLALAQGLECDFWTADSRLFNALQDAHLEWLHFIEEIPPLS